MNAPTAVGRLSDTGGEWVTIDGRHVLIGGDKSQIFKTTDAALAWGDKNMPNDELGEGHDEALTNYQQGYMATAVNDAFRDGTPMSAQLTKRVKQLDEAIQLSTVPEAVTAFRVVSAPSFPDFHVGSVLTDKGYSSTTLSQQFMTRKAIEAREPIIFEYQIPTGFHAAYMGLYDANYRHEAELLLPRGAAWYVESITGGGRTSSGNLRPSYAKLRLIK